MRYHARVRISPENKRRKIGQVEREFAISCINGNGIRFLISIGWLGFFFFVFFLLTRVLFRLIHGFAYKRKTATWLDFRGDISVCV